MKLRKITNNNSVRYVSKDDQSRSEQTPPISTEIKKNASYNKLSKKNKQIISNISGERFKVIKG